MKLCVKYRINPTEGQEDCLNKLGFYATKLYNTDNYMRCEAWNGTDKSARRRSRRSQSPTPEGCGLAP